MKAKQKFTSGVVKGSVQENKGLIVTKMETAARAQGTARGLVLGRAVVCRVKCLSKKRGTDIEFLDFSQVLGLDHFGGRQQVWLLLLTNLAGGSKE